MKARENMKEARENITIAALIAAVVIVPAAIISGIVLLTSRNDTMSNTVFFGIFVADLLGLYRWSRRRATPSKAATRSASVERMSIHQFIAHLKMHPELLPAGMTELDLESFRKLSSRQHRTGFENWLTQLNYGGTYGQRAK